MKCSCRGRCTPDLGLYFSHFPTVPTPPMNWPGNQHATAITAAIYCLGFAIFVFASFSPFVSYDAWWHLKMGQDLLGEGLSPRIDHYSFTHVDEPIASIPYLFQILLSLFVSVFGGTLGFQLTKLFAFALTMYGTLLFYREIRAPWPIIAITLPYFLVFLLFRFNHVRPEIFEGILVMLALVLYLRAARSFSHKYLALITALMLFWVNYHAAILGYVIFFGLFFDKAIEMIRDNAQGKVWLHWAAWGALVFLVGFANPDLRHPFFALLNFGSEWTNVAEFTPTNQYTPHNAFFWVFWLVAAYIAGFLAMHRQYGLALVCAIFAFQSWQSIVIVAISGMVVTALMALSLSRVDFDRMLASAPPRSRYLLGGVAVLIAVSGIVQAGYRANNVYQKDNSKDFPIEIAAYLQNEYPQGGRIFNRMRHGGYLLHRLSPEFKVYIDGRLNILYPADFAREFDAMYHAENNTSIAEAVSKYDIDFAIYPLRYAWFPLTDDSHAMSAEFASRDFMLLSTRKNNFPLSSRLLYFPMCWQSLEPQSVAAEFELAKQILPQDSVLLPPLRSLVELHSATDPNSVFTGPDAQLPRSIYHQRLLGYAALDLGAAAQAFEYFRAIEGNDTLDLLMLAYSALNMGNYAATEEILTIALSEGWALAAGRNLNGFELAVVVTLFERLRQHQPLSAQRETQLVQLTNIVAQAMPGLELPLEDVVPRGRCESVFLANKVSHQIPD